MTDKLFPLFAMATLFLAFPILAADKPDFKSATRPPDNPPPKETLSGKSVAEIEKKVESSWNTIVFEKDGKPVRYLVTLETDEGNIEIEFFAEDAPNHARSFIALAKAGFFDGLIFHRCIPNFVIQGGCPSGSGTGGPGYCLKPEFNKRPHLRGVLSMARAQATDSAGSQFFICVGSPRFLDEKYTVFGRVTDGMDVADRIVARPTGANDRPKEPVAIKKAIVRTADAKAAKSAAKNESKEN